MFEEFYSMVSIHRALSKQDLSFLTHIQLYLIKYSIIFHHGNTAIINKYGYKLITFVGKI